MNTEQALEALRTAIRKEAAAELVKLHDERSRTVQPGLWLAAVTLDPSLDTWAGKRAGTMVNGTWVPNDR